MKIYIRFLIMALCFVLQNTQVSSQRTLADYIRFSSSVAGRPLTTDSIRNHGPHKMKGHSIGLYSQTLETVSVRSANMDTMPPALVESEIPSYVVWYTRLPRNERVADA